MTYIGALDSLRRHKIAEVWPHADRDLIAEERFAPAYNADPRVQHAGRFEFELFSVIWIDILQFKNPLMFTEFAYSRWPGLSTVRSEITDNRV